MTLNMVKTAELGRRLEVHTGIQETSYTLQRRAQPDMTTPLSLSLASHTETCILRVTKRLIDGFEYAAREPKTAVPDPDLPLPPCRSLATVAPQRHAPQAVHG